MSEEQTKLNKEELKALFSFRTTCDSRECYTVPKEMMERLAEIGVICHAIGGIYYITEFGDYVLRTTHD